MRNNIRILFTVVLCIISYSIAVSQGHSKKHHNYKKHPHWIQMMDDPNVNYHEAVKAFDEFWKGRGEPEREETGKEEEKRSFIERLFVSEEKERAENSKYFIQWKRFKQWERDVEPYVQADGSILSREEQIKIWENSRK